MKPDYRALLIRFPISLTDPRLGLLPPHAFSTQFLYLLMDEFPNANITVPITHHEGAYLLVECRMPDLFLAEEIDDIKTRIEYLADQMLRRLSSNLQAAQMASR